MSRPPTVPSKTSGKSTVIPKLSSRLQSKRPIIPSKTEIKVDQEDLDDIINNLSSIVKRSEKLLTPNTSYITTTVRRTSSLHINNRENLSNSFVKTSNSHHDKLTDSNRDIQRRSIRNFEKFSGIKCSLPSGTSTIPNTFKGLEKHHTPTKTKQANISSSLLIDNPITPEVINGKSKSPWRLRFEKFLNHQELTPLSPANQSIAFTSSSNKENRTPSFRLPTRRTNKIHLISKKDD